jgi:hypothetical protein
MRKPKASPTKATIFLNNETQSDTFTSRTEAIAWVMKLADLKRFCGHAVCLDHHSYVAFPKSAGWAKITSLR